MTYNPQPRPDRLLAIALWLLTALVAVLAGWLLPVSWKSIHPVTLAAAGKGTSTTGDLADQYLKAGRLGPAELLLKAAVAGGNAEAAGKLGQLRELTAREPDLKLWGGRDPQMAALFNTNAAAAAAGTDSLVKFFMIDAVRQVVRTHLAGSTSPGVQVLLRTRELQDYQEFLPATGPGGLPLEATITLTALLYGGEYLSPALAREFKVLAEEAVAAGKSAALEPVFYALVALDSRLNWTQLIELLRLGEQPGTLVGLAELLKQHPDRLPWIYSAIVMGRSPDKVVGYLERFGESGFTHLQSAVASGQGGVELLLARNLALGSAPGGTLAVAAPVVLKWPRAMLAAKILLFFVAGFAVSRIWASAPAASPGAAQPGVFGVQAQMRSAGEPPVVPGQTTGALGSLIRLGAIAIVTALLTATSEPLLFRAFKPGKLTPTYRLAGLSNSPIPPHSDQPSPSLMNLDQSTIISIMLFALLQILVYMVCLMKIREIDLQPTSAGVKLRLMENEENLFDAGLYVGIAGTAAALVLQVMQFIEANLLAAYASNLFGILCVALVKIGHVRSFKRNLILQLQTEQGSPYSQRAGAV